MVAPAAWPGQFPFSAAVQPFRPSQPASSFRCRSPDLSAAAQPFRQSERVASAGRRSLSFEPKTASSGAAAAARFADENEYAMNGRKAVVVEISASKHSAAKAPARRPALPGMEYLVGVDSAAKEARKSARSSERKDGTRADEEGAAAARAAEAAAAARRRRDDAETKEPPAAAAGDALASPPAVPEGPGAAAPDSDEMPELNEIMALLENRSVSKEERRRRIDVMFG